MALPAGTRLGHYEILEPLGAGGMGEVFRARDTKLGRKVAVKVLPTNLLGDEGSRRRFRKEAEALLRLNHPHIATIHDFDTASGTDFLVMELVQGHSVQDELQAKGALPEKTVVRLGAQLARGLQAAHEQGIVHRDLKPSNLQLTPDGLLKILDFGLAHLLPKEPTAGDETAPTETAVGGVAGTLPYMSPEQLRGRGVDARTDLYAAGAVLHEMAAGRRLFSKPSQAELTDAILHEEPTPLRQVNDRISPGLEAVVLKALDKDPNLRYQTAKELLVDLERQELRSDSGGAARSQAVQPAAVSVRRRTGWAMLGVGISVVALAAVTWWTRPGAAPTVSGWTEISRHVGQLESRLATDGPRVFFVERQSTGWQLSQISATGGDAVPIPAEIPWPAICDISPDHSRLLVWSQEGSTWRGPLWVVPLPAGTPYRLADLVGHDASWSPDGRHIVIAAGHGLLLANGDGTALETLVTLPGAAFAPRWSPDGRRIRFALAGSDGPSSFWEVGVSGNDLRQVLPGHVPSSPLWGANGGWTPDGRYFVFLSDRDGGGLWAVEEGAAHFPRSRRDPWRLASSPMTLLSVTVSEDGEQLFLVAVKRRGELVQHRATTDEIVPFLSGISAEQLDYSPDGEWIAYVTYPEAALWRCRSDGSEQQQITRSPLRAAIPRWSPDGQRIAFSGSSGPGPSPRQLYLVPASGGVAEPLLPEPDAHQGDPGWSSDGRFITYGHQPATGPEPWTIRVLDLETRAVTTLPGSEGLYSPRPSPDGRYVAALALVPSDALVVFDEQSREWTTLRRGLVGWPSWSQDGRVLRAFWFEPGFRPTQCEVIRAGDWTSERVVELPELRATGTFGFWTGTTPDGTVLALREASAWGIYALDFEAP